MDAPELLWSHSSMLPQQPAAAAALGAAAEAPFQDVFGPSLAAGAYLAPRLLAADKPVVAASYLAAPSGATVITGGLGALGTLIAAQLVASSSPGRNNHGSGGSSVVLLGRSIDLHALEAALGSTWRRAAASSGSAPVLTVAKCDSASAADAAGLVCSLRAAGSQVGTIMHTAGVLKVRGTLRGAGSACMEHACMLLCITTASPRE